MYEHIAYLVIMCRKTIHEITALESFAEIKMNEMFQIRVGEYWDLTECLYTEDNTEKELDDVKIEFRRVFDTGYMHRHYKDIDLSNGKYIRINLNYSRLVNMDFHQSIFEEATITGTQFKNCNLENTDFSYTIANGAEFTNCILNNSNFSNFNKYLEFDVKKIKRKMFEKTLFTKCELINVDFSKSNLDGVKFVDCYIKDCNFDEANMENVEMDMELNRIRTTAVATT